MHSDRVAVDTAHVLPSDTGHVLPSDTQFSLPAVDDPPTTEVGVVLMGLAARHLLAGLGIAALAGDPATVTLLVDRLRHRGQICLTEDHLTALGADQWRRWRSALGPFDMPVVPLRDAWAQAFRAVASRDSGASEVAMVYLTACWLRGSEVDDLAGPD